MSEQEDVMSSIPNSSPQNSTREDMGGTTRDLSGCSTSPAHPNIRGTRRESLMRVIISLIAGAILWVGMVRQQLPESLPKHQFEPPEMISTVDAVYPFNSIAFGTVVLHVTRHSSKCSLISSVSRGARHFLIPKSSDGREGRGLSVARRVVE